MKREIKFRYWDSVIKHYCYSDDFNWPSALERLDQFFAKAKDYAECVEQYTGLKDADGKEIYEGDIVMDTTPMYTSVPRYEVIKWITTENTNWGVNGWYGVPTERMHRKIIGNIHQTPELLK